jgi:hypothetical protein
VPKKNQIARLTTKSAQTENKLKAWQPLADG